MYTVILNEMIDYIFNDKHLIKDKNHNNWSIYHS